MKFPDFIEKLPQGEVPMAGSLAFVRDLPDDFSRCRRQQRLIENTGNLKEFEMQHIMNVLKECLGNKSKAAKTLGISRKALYKRFKEFPIL